jgi:hypothetical protein
MKKYHLATLSRQVYLVLSGGNTFRMKKMSQKGFKGIRIFCRRPQKNLFSFFRVSGSAKK